MGTALWQRGMKGEEEERICALSCGHVLVAALASPGIAPPTSAGHRGDVQQEFKENFVGRRRRRLKTPLPAAGVMVLLMLCLQLLACMTAAHRSTISAAKQPDKYKNMKARKVREHRACAYIIFFHANLQAEHKAPYRDA
jgi:hypothetical protein